MKLDELFQTKQRERPVKAEKFRNSKTSRQSDKWGNFGYVHPNKKDPHLIKKVAHDYSYKDSYYHYIKAISDSGIAQHNPYAPRVYKIDVYKDEDSGATKYNADIEKLQPVASLKMPQLVRLWEQITGSPKRPNSRDPEDIRADINEYLSFLFNGRETTPDKNLKEMIDFIAGVKKDLESDGNYWAGYDIKLSNFMIRTTPYGAQLVITDPLS